MKSSTQVMIFALIGVGVGVAVPLLRNGLTAPAAPAEAATRADCSTPARHDTLSTPNVAAQSTPERSRIEAVGLPPVADEDERPAAVLPPTSSTPPAPARGATPRPSSEEELARKILGRHADWIFKRDRKGNVLRDELGKPILTEEGRRYAGYVFEAERRGITSVMEQHRYALNKLSSVEVGRRSTAGAGRQTSPTVPTIQATGPSRIIPNLRGMRVAVIADSISCQALSRCILRLNGASEERVRDADVILVIVRSSLLSPLKFSHDSYDDLKRDASSQLNISGPIGHIYVFRLNADLEPRELFHSRFDWEAIADAL